MSLSDLQSILNKYNADNRKKAMESVLRESIRLSVNEESMRMQRISAQKSTMMSRI